nr:MAG TPA: hypothetical protein [Caudoviricetes sp.]
MYFFSFLKISHPHGIRKGTTYVMPFCVLMFSLKNLSLSKY